jgi:hypothetical protein
MRPRTTLILLVLGVLTLGLGWQFGVRDVPHEQNTMAQGTLVFPDLVAGLQKAARVEILHQGKTLAITLAGGKWGLPDHAGYPVQPEKLRQLLTGLTELREMEQRTSDPADFAKLGVEDPKGASADSTLLRVLDGSGKPIAELIVGHSLESTQSSASPEVYIRRPGDNQSWLAEGNLQLDTDPMAWLVSDIVNIDETKLADVTVTRVDQPGGPQTLQFARVGDKLVLKSPADHPKLDDDKLADVGRALESLSLNDVKPAARQSGTKLGTAVFTTTDGLVVEATVFKAGKDLWAQFAVSGSGAAQKQAAALQAKVKGWSYQIGDWKQAALVPDMDDIKAPPPPPAAAPAPDAAAKPPG